MNSKPDIGAVLEHYGLNVLDRHGWVPCKCVIHEDTQASAAYNLDNQAYNCLVCQVLGDVYTLGAMHAMKASFPGGAAAWAALQAQMKTYAAEKNAAKAKAAK